MIVRGEMTEARRAGIMLAITIAAGKRGAINHTRSGRKGTMAMSECQLLPTGRSTLPAPKGLEIFQQMRMAATDFQAVTWQGRPFLI
jgi:hypothetical protein